MNKSILKAMEKSIKLLEEDYYTKKAMPKMIYPIILKYYGAEVILSQSTTQAMFDNMRDVISKLESDIRLLKEKKNFKQRIEILFTGKVKERNVR